MFLRKARGRAFVAVFLLAALLATMIIPGAALAAQPYDDLALQAARNNYELFQSGKTVGGSYGNFAAYDAYVLVKAGINLTEWVYGETSFDTGISGLINATIDNERTAGQSSAKRVAHEYLTALEMGDDRADDLLGILVSRQADNVTDSITADVYGSIDSADVLYGIYSNMPAFEALARTETIDQINEEATITYILRAQDPSTKAWPTANEDAYITNDFATTAQAVRVLNALKQAVDGDAATAVQAAITSGINWLKSKQLADGSFKNLYDDPLVDAVEALLTLDYLGLDLDDWQTGGKSAVDYLRDEALSDDGTFGGSLGSGNLIDNTAALEACLLLEAQVDAAAVLSGSTGSGGGGGGQSDRIAVRIEVTGKDGRTIFSRSTVYLEEDDRNSRGHKVGVTPVGALDKTGLSYDYDSISYIHTIAGQGPEGMNGWMFKINGVISSRSAIDVKLNNNDSVVWFYSTDPGNIPGGGSPQIPQQNLTPAQIITLALEADKEVIIDLEKRSGNLVDLGQETIQKLTEAQKTLQLTNRNLQISLPPQALTTEQVNGALAGGAGLQLGAVEVTGAEKQDILTKAQNGQSSGIFEIGGRIFDLTAQIVNTDSSGNTQTEKITEFGEPVQVTLDLSGLNLTEEDIAMLTAVRYEKAADGSIIPVKLGGSYDPESKTFTFYTEKFSYYGVAKAEKLVTVSLGINKLTTTVNGKRGYTDVPPILLNDRTMVPLRFIAETLGAQVQWLAESRTAEIIVDGKTVRLVADETMPGLDVPATIRSGRLLVPLRFVSETLGARVTWFASTQNIEIVY